jgi:hypothetical protein
MRVTGPCPARPHSRGGQARPLLLLTTLEHLLRIPATTVRDTLDQAALLLTTLPGRGGPTGPWRAQCRADHAERGMALSGRTESISRLAGYVRAGAVFCGRDLPVPA